MCIEGLKREWVAFPEGTAGITSEGLIAWISTSRLDGLKIYLYPRRSRRRWPSTRVETGGVFQCRQPLAKRAKSLLTSTACDDDVTEAS